MMADDGGGNDGGSGERGGEGGGDGDDDNGGGGGGSLRQQKGCEVVSKCRMGARAGRGLGHGFEALRCLPLASREAAGATQMPPTDHPEAGRPVDGFLDVI